MSTDSAAADRLIRECGGVPPLYSFDVESAPGAPMTYGLDGICPRDVDDLRTVIEGEQATERMRRKALEAIARNILRDAFGPDA